MSARTFKKGNGYKVCAALLMLSCETAHLQGQLGQSRQTQSQTQNQTETQTETQTLISASVPPASSMVGPDQPELLQRYPRYLIQSEDVLNLTFPLSPEINQTVTVQPDGYINLQNGRSVHAQGLSVPELVTELKSSYTDILHEPIINVDVKDFQRPFFTVNGQVARPGQYDLRASINVAEALAIAGGMLPTAKTQVFLLHRTENHMYQVRKLAMNSLLNGRHMAEEPMIKPGDMIYVPEKFITNFKKYVPYSASTGSYVNLTQP